MKSILIVDPCCPEPYDFETLEKKAMGGTEATVLRVFKGLTDAGYAVQLSQRDWGPDFSQGSYDIVITLRDANHYVQNIKKYPNAKHFLWMHDAIDAQYRDHLLHFLHNIKGNLVTVSDWHKIQVVEALKPILTTGNIRVNRVYNPLAQYCTKNGSEYDPHRLVFFSSPHKGLDQVLAMFKRLHDYDSRYTLQIGNPGYFDTALVDQLGVSVLGKLPHKEIVERVRGALCMFYPQTVFPETFGLVYAESNAVGTPVIGHQIGAAHEILYHRSELTDCRDVEGVIKKVVSWSNEGMRPIVKARPEFHINEVLKSWIKLF